MVYFRPRPHPESVSVSKQRPEQTSANTTHNISSNTAALCYCVDLTRPLGGGSSRRKGYSALTWTMSLGYFASVPRCSAGGSCITSSGSVTGVSGISLCWEFTIGSSVLLKQSRTWFLAAHVEAVHGIEAALLLSLSDTAFSRKI